MNPQHATTTPENTQTNDITSPDGSLTATASRLGAELISLRRHAADGHGHGFLHRDGRTDPPESGWANHATVMGYHIHRLVGGQSSYRGRPLVGGNHGFLRHTLFDAPRTTPDSLTFRRDPGRIDPANYPLQVAFAITYLAENDGWLRVRFSFENHEPDETAHVSFGLHPGFAVSSPQQAAILLPPGIYRHHLAPGDFLSGETLDIDHPGGRAPFPPDQLPGSFLLEWIDTADRRITIEDPATGHRVVVDTGDAPFVTLWSDGGPFLCVEPCWGLPDHHQQRPFEQKSGIQSIPPRQSIQAHCRIQCDRIPLNTA